MSFSLSPCPNPRPDPVPVSASLQAILMQGSQWQARGLDPRTGADCYGLLVFAFGLAGIALPETAEEGEYLFVIVPPPYHPWDVAFFNLQPYHGTRHVGLLLAPPWGFQVSRATNGLGRFCLYQAFWRRTFSHGLRYQAWV